jgi:hypothetical protein
MAIKLVNLESLMPDDAAKLAALGILDSDELLRQVCDRTVRQRLVQSSEVSETVLLRLARIGDFARIVGVVEAHVSLLEALGIVSMAKLRSQDPTELVKALRRKNVELTLVRSVPPESTIGRWIADAKALPDVLQC